MWPLDFEKMDLYPIKTTTFEEKGAKMGMMANRALWYQFSALLSVFAINAVIKRTGLALRCSVYCVATITPWMLMLKVIVVKEEVFLSVVTAVHNSRLYNIFFLTHHTCPKAYTMGFHVIDNLSIKVDVLNIFALKHIWSGAFCFREFIQAAETTVNLSENCCLVWL